MRYLITIAYDGSKYYGFQRQDGKITVQGELEKALTIINKEPVIIKGAGRTDRGVHAYGQKAHFNLSLNILPAQLLLALNHYLPDYIRITKCQQESDNFHARFDVKQKTYEYQIYCDNNNPLFFDYYYCYRANYNLHQMRLAAKKMVGIHDYKNFVSGSRNNSQAILYKIKIKQQGKIIVISLTGKSFYRYMVRNIVGALIAVGLKQKPVNYIEELLTGDTKCCVTAPANGLYLMDIKY